MSGNIVIHIPYDWYTIDKTTGGRSGVTSFNMGTIVHAYQVDCGIHLTTETRSYVLHPPYEKTDEGRKYLEAFKLNFPVFPYYRDYHVYESIINICERMDALENKFTAIMDYLEKINHRIDTSTGIFS